IRWKISMHQDEFALEQISDEIYERKSSQPVDGLLGTPSMMMKAVVYMSKQRGGHHYIFGKVLEPGKAPEPEDNMISGQVIINKTDPNYFIVSKIRYLWSIGRYYSNYIDRIVEVSTGNNGIMTVTAAGQMTDKIQGQWELQINPAAMYMVQNAKFTRFDSEGQLSETPEIIINNSGVKWFENLCIPQETSFTGLGNNVNVPINYELISQKADLEFIKQANEFLDPPYNVQTTHSIISGSANFDSMYEAGETKANANGGNDTKDSFFDELLYLRQRNPSTFGIPALIEAYEKFISKYQEYPRIAEALFELANIYESSWDGHDSNKAMELFETAAKTAAPNTDIWKKANIYWFNRLINSDIQNAENILLNMKNHLRENDYVLEAEIEDRYVYFYGIQKRFDEAEKHYAKVLALYNDREKTTENIKDRITIEDCYRTSSQTLLASINNAIDLTPAQRLALIREIGNKHNLFTIFNFYDETIKQLESQVSWQDMSVELKKQESVDNEDSTDLDFAKREISGFVEDKNGNPIGSASIELLNKELVLLPEPVKIGDKTVKVITQNYETGTLKKDGSFKISELNPGKTDILIKAANYQTKIVKDIPTGTENLKIILDQPKAYKLSGKVTDSKGNPIKDVQITLAQDTDKPILTKVKTNDKGLFEFEELLGPLTEIASQLLLAQKDGFGMYGKYLDTTGFESYVEITLLPEEKATGRVVNEKGKPVPGAEVMVWSLHGKQSSFIFRRAWQDIAPKVKTDSNGKFVLPALAEKCDFDILAVADGYAYSQETYSTGQYDDYGRSMESGGILVGGGNPRTEGELEFVLKKPVTLSGTVTYEKTKLPVEGVKVVYCAMEFSPGGNECVTDKDGKFVLENIYPSPGNLCVLLERPSENTLSEWTAAAIQFENLKSGQTKENLKLVLVKGGIISGKVTDSSGNPLKDIAIHFFSAARPPRYNVPNYEFMHSDENGLWSYRFPPGEVYVWVITRIKDANWYKVKSSKKVKNSYMEITSVYSTKIKSGQEIKDINIKLDKELPENSIYR
ncbi:MAG: carboxypeptidase regulatory-like domain-containing protein, partial [Sedimentisphaerales bacterium]|nr:carboxypeptidase regulatory-like domain-containing protein [Sedimentisphaerales bacterium]